MPPTHDSVRSDSEDINCPSFSPDGRIQNDFVLFERCNHSVVEIVGADRTSKGSHVTKEDIIHGLSHRTPSSSSMLPIKRDGQVERPEAEQQQVGPSNSSSVGKKTRQHGQNGRTKSINEQQVEATSSKTRPADAESTNINGWSRQLETPPPTPRTVRQTTPDLSEWDEDMDSFG
ncbi:hypothetical protein FQN50_007572 [Emmonsiellopsis sp. PD_5]|nr:hypothetical protein FQN50_007572 [Emmonsiellopsis sp. PD_5]